MDRRGPYRNGKDGRGKEGIGKALMILVTNIATGRPFDCWVDPHHVSTVQAHRDNDKGVDCDRWWVSLGDKTSSILVNEVDCNLIVIAKGWKK